MRNCPGLTGRRHRRGFTLIEILLVIGLIAMLAAFVVPNFVNTGERARIDATRCQVAAGGNIAAQILIFHHHLGRYPAVLKELVAKPEDETERPKWAGPYIQDAAALVDGWGRDLQYKYPGDVNTTTYDLWSRGPDGQDGTDDDIANYSIGEVIRRPN